MGRMLVWVQHGTMFHTFSDFASGIVYPHEGGFHWEIFVKDEIASWHGQAETLNSAINHVEGNFIGRNLRSDLAISLASAG